jgi:hypothetical protein
MHGDDTYQPYAIQMQRGLQLFADWVNSERGGLLVNGSRLGIRFDWVGDRSDSTLVANATATALRLAREASAVGTFAIAPWSSGLTQVAARQSSTDGVLMMSGSAAKPEIYTENNWTFGVLPPASSYHDTALAAVVAAARALDAAASGGAAVGDGGEAGGGSALPHTLPAQLRSTERPCFGGTGCEAALLLGFVQTDASFPRSQCSDAAALATRHGLRFVRNFSASEGGGPVATDLTGHALSVSHTVLPHCCASTLLTGGAGLCVLQARRDHPRLDGWFDTVGGHGSNSARTRHCTRALFSLWACALPVSRSAAQLAQAEALMSEFQARNVSVIVGCTYEVTARYVGPGSYTCTCVGVHRLVEILVERSAKLCQRAVVALGSIPTASSSDVWPADAVYWRRVLLLCRCEMIYRVSRV